MLIKSIIPRQSFFPNTELSIPLTRSEGEGAVTFNNVVAPLTFSETDVVSLILTACFNNLNNTACYEKDHYSEDFYLCKDFADPKKVLSIINSLILLTFLRAAYSTDLSILLRTARPYYMYLKHVRRF
jgi:hypothetical protein